MAVTLEPQPAEPVPTAAAGKARRLVYMALEDYYDEEKRTYKPGHSDASIATECGVGEKCVAQIREESFGPLAVPLELSNLMTELRTIKRDCTASHEGFIKLIADFDQKLERLITKNGWKMP